MQTKCDAIRPQQFQLAKPGDVFLELYSGQCHTQFGSVCNVAGKARRALFDDPDRDEKLMLFSGYLRSLLVAARGRQTKAAAGHHTRDSSAAVAEYWTRYNVTLHQNLTIAAESTLMSGGGMINTSGISISCRSVHKTEKSCSTSVADLDMT